MVFQEFIGLVESLRLPQIKKYISSEVPIS